VYVRQSKIPIPLRFKKATAPASNSSGPGTLPPLIFSISEGSETVRPELQENILVTSSLDDSRRTIELADRYVILPTIDNWGISALQGKSLPEGFSYRSDTNTEWLSIEQLRELV